MTDDPIGEEIPELLGHLEVSLNAPDATAIHAGLSQRQSARKRMLGTAGVFVAVLAIGGGILALNRDDTTSTVAADGILDLADDDTDVDSAVAGDSAPREVGPVPVPGILLNNWSEPSRTAISVTSCSNGARIQADRSTWLPGRIPSLWGDKNPGQVTTIVRDDLLVAIDDAGNAARFYRHVPGTGVGAPCNDFTEPTLGMPIDLAPARLPILAALGEVPIPEIQGALNFAPPEDEQGLLEFSSLCRGGAGYWALWGDDGFTVVDEAPQPPVGEDSGIVVRCAGPPHRLDLFRKGDAVKVTVSPDLVVLDVAGETHWQLVLDRQPSTDVAIDDEQSSPTTSIVSPPESTVPPQATTTTAAPPAAPPLFAPNADLALSGQWTVVGMWDSDVPVDIAGFRGSLRVSGRSFGGHDGCNDNGNGSFFATPDGRIQLQSGSSTDMACLDGEVSDLFLAGAFGADRWGRTSTGTFVLTNGVVVVEFERTETTPAATLRNVSAPLHTIWNSDDFWDYDNPSTKNPETTLTFVIDEEHTDIAVLVAAPCGEFDFKATFEDGTEGTISFEALDSASTNTTACIPSANAANALEALARADYFLAAYGGIQLWDGPTPLAIFADE